MTSARDWTGSVGDVWAEEWRRTDRSFSELSTHLDAAIVEAAPATGQALDIGCGAGTTSLALAAARPALRITGLDLSDALIAIARDSAEAVPTLDFHVADIVAGRLPASDLLFSRHGVMFFADPVAAFARLHAAAAPGARLVFSCFRTASANAFADPLVAAITGIAPASPSAYAPGPFGFADADFTAAVLGKAGWRHAEARRVDYGYVAGEGDDALADAVSFFSRIGPVAAALRAATDRDAMVDRLVAALKPYAAGGRVTLPASAWVWRACA